MVTKLEADNNALQKDSDELSSQLAATTYVLAKREQELAAANRLLDEQAGYASDADCYQRELAALRAAVEKLAGEWEEPLESTHVGNTSHAYAKRLRDLLK